MVELLFGRKTPTTLKSSVKSVTLDATLSEDSEFSNRITSFPVESGGAISDHSIREPEAVTIEGLISETPIAFLGGKLTSAGEFKDPVGDGYAFLLSLGGYSTQERVPPDFIGPVQDSLTSIAGTQYTQKEAGLPQLIDILTEFRLYTDMGIERLSVRRDKDTGDSLKFTASFKKVRLVEVKYDLAMSKVQSPVAAPSATKQAAPKKPVANKETAVPLESKLHMDFMGNGAGYLNP